MSMDLEQRDIVGHVVQPDENSCPTAVSTCLLIAMLSSIGGRPLFPPLVMLGKHWKFFVFSLIGIDVAFLLLLVVVLLTYLYHQSVRFSYIRTLSFTLNL